MPVQPRVLGYSPVPAPPRVPAIAPHSKVPQTATGPATGPATRGPGSQPLLHSWTGDQNTYRPTGREDAFCGTT
ncbi:hypothetical protein DICSQDRAFT_140919 [Dichomitus squalens LYAD-421 SS1]|uniref:Uncharacterized protein n=1 Tax=Dichomitus squalens (strain LYAD-421) TaxID=732165 RepID=R7SKW0_DICSQ|nr:uncharacterized protein DICSQDRAFT_140919 [Dichomitus squalens LYAD-421 SS1]EJF56791.1 hypothetical protein DICSQDRAFT_140919 [Dichomitus squalens LYAD-421 SS1]